MEEKPVKPHYQLQQSPHQGGGPTMFTTLDTSSLVREKVDSVRQNTTNIHYEIHRIQQRVNKQSDIEKQINKIDLAEKLQTQKILQDQGSLSLPKNSKQEQQDNKFLSEDDEEPNVPKAAASPPQKKFQIQQAGYHQDQKEKPPQLPRISVLSNDQYGQISEISNFESFAPQHPKPPDEIKRQIATRILMDSRSAYEPLENNLHLQTVSRPSTGSAQEGNQRQKEQDFPGMKELEFRAVETIEEFFRPELAKQQDDLNSQIFNTEFEINEGESFVIPGADTTQKTFEKTQLKFRMGFPDMSYLNPNINGAPVQVQQTFYKNYLAQESDIKLQREGFIQARENMPNNTFIKLFNKQTNQGVVAGTGPDKKSEGETISNNDHSVQYFDQNFNESGIDDDSTYKKKPRHFKMKPPTKDELTDSDRDQVKIVYTRSPNKTKSQNKVGIEIQTQTEPQQLSEGPKVHRSRQTSEMQTQNGQPIVVAKGNFMSQFIEGQPARALINRNTKAQNNQLTTVESKGSHAHSNNNQQPYQQHQFADLEGKIGSHAADFLEQVLKQNNGGVGKSDKKMIKIIEPQQTLVAPEVSAKNFQIHNTRKQSLDQPQPGKTYRVVQVVEEGVLLPPILKKDQIQKTTQQYRQEGPSPMFSPQTEQKFPKLQAEIVPVNSNLSEKLPKIEEDVLSAGEADMQSFVTSYYQGLNMGKPHLMELSLKKMRLHHRVLSQVSFNAYKLMTQSAELITLRQGQILYKQKTTASDLYFILYGALQVSIQQEGAVGDIVRGGNVIGEESIFGQPPIYRETIQCCSKQCSLMRITSSQLFNLQNKDFQSVLGAGARAQYQQDFQQLYIMLQQTHLTKEQWRAKAKAFLQAKLKTEESIQPSFLEFKSNNAARAKLQ